MITTLIAIASLALSLWAIYLAGKLWIATIAQMIRTDGVAKATQVLIDLGMSLDNARNTIDKALKRHKVYRP